MGTDEDEVIRIVEKCPNAAHFGGAGLLAGSQRIEADHDEGVDAGQKSVVQRRLRPIVVDAFRCNHLMTSSGACQLREGGEVGFQKMIQETRNTLIEAGRIRKLFESR